MLRKIETLAAILKMDEMAASVSMVNVTTVKIKPVVCVLMVIY
jgi:hypothetical protein